MTSWKGAVKVYIWLTTKSQLWLKSNRTSTRLWWETSCYLVSSLCSPIWSTGLPRSPRSLSCVRSTQRWSTFSEDISNRMELPVLCTNQTQVWTAFTGLICITDRQYFWCTQPQLRVWRICLYLTSILLTTLFSLTPWVIQMLTCSTYSVDANCHLLSNWQSTGSSVQTPMSKRFIKRQCATR